MLKQIYLFEKLKRMRVLERVSECGTAAVDCDTIRRYPVSCTFAWCSPGLHLNENTPRDRGVRHRSPVLQLKKSIQSVSPRMFPITEQTTRARYRGNALAVVKVLGFDQTTEVSATPTIQSAYNNGGLFCQIRPHQVEGNRGR